MCAPDSEGAQECSGEGGRAARACFSCAHTCWRGIWSVKIIAMGCMSAQMDVELKEGQPLVSEPQKITMDRGGDVDVDAGDDNWWHDPTQKRMEEMKPKPKPEDKRKKKKKKKKSKQKKKTNDEETKSPDD